MDNGHRNSAFAQAVELAGGQTEFARAIGVTQQAVSKMLKKGKLGADYLVLAERATGGRITRQQLRPDLFEHQESPGSGLF